jgi:uncharacterized membrane protein
MRESVRRFPMDVPAVVLILAVGNAVILAGIDVLSVGFGLGLALFLPGYALLTLLSPRAAGRGGLGAGERLALSFATSVALAPLFVLVLTVVIGANITTTTVLSAIDAFVLVSLFLGLVRRLRLPGDERFSPPIGRWLRGVVGSTSTVRESPVTAVLVLSMVLAVATFGFAVAVPNEGERFTEFYLLTEGADGPVAGEYPAELTEGGEETLLVGVENNEHQPLRYEVNVEIQRVESVDGELTVLERERLTDLDLVLAHGESATVEHTVSPSMTGEDLRLRYTLSVEGSDEPYRELYLWVDVVPEDGDDDQGDD